MNRTIFLFVIITVFPRLSFSSTILDRNWTFNSSAEVTFTIKDTLTVSIHFPNLIPDSRLLGYCRFHVTVRDSNPGPMISGKSFLYQFQFDSGFNAFDHVLTLDLNYSSGLPGNKVKDPHKYRMYMDPFPVSKMHQWFAVADSNFHIDTTSGTLRIVYYHNTLPKQTLQKAAFDGLPKKTIASTGYPFDYGLFVFDSSAAVHFQLHNNVSKSNFSQTGHIYTISGRNTGLVASAIKPSSGLNDGCFVVKANNYGYRENTKYAIVKKVTLR